MDNEPRPAIPTVAVGYKVRRVQRMSQRPRLWRRILWRVRDLALIIIDTLQLAILQPSRAARDPLGKSKLAVVFVHGIGDLVLLHGGLEDMLRPYRASYRIILICSSTARAFAEHAVRVDEIVDIDRVRMRRNPGYRWRVIRKIAHAGFTVALQPNFNRDLLIEDALMRATGARERIGSAGTPMFISGLARIIGDRWYTKLVPASPTLLHDIERYAEFRQALGAPSVPSRPQLPRMASPTKTPRRPYVLFAVGSSSPLKSWSLRNFIWVATAVVERHNIRAVFCAGPGDLMDSVGLPIREDPRFEDCFGRTGISELLALIQQAEVVVGNDSAAVHLAAALGVPSVCILGGGIVGRYHPYPSDLPRQPNDPFPVSLPEPMACFNCGWMCRYDLEPDDPAPCIERVERSDVLEAVLAKLPRR